MKRATQKGEDRLGKKRSCLYPIVSKHPVNKETLKSLPIMRVSWRVGIPQCTSLFDTPIGTAGFFLWRGSEKNETHPLNNAYS